MTSGVAILLTGPLQSWGGPAPDVYRRPTEATPTLSGIVGLIANALGRRRSDPIDDIAQGANLTVRVDRPGTLLDDFHTVGTPGRYALEAGDSAKQLKNPVVTSRHYLSDAAFVAIYAPPPNGMSAQQVLNALKHPARPIYLGRRSCPPSERVALGLTDPAVPPVQTLASSKILRDPPTRRRGASMHDAGYYDAADDTPTVGVLIETTAPRQNSHTSTIRKDAPSTFDPRRLYHRNRHVRTETIQVSVDECAGRGREAIAALYDSLSITP